jgi:phage terminase large subunit-like protein
VLSAAVTNAIVIADPAGNQKIDKEKSNGRGPVRIDGAVTLAMALQLAKRAVREKPIESVFEVRARMKREAREAAAA